MIQLISSTMERPNLSSNIGKIKDKWKYCSDFTASSNNTVPFETSWAARNVHACSFCKRRFKSAQALGGHMNVHRRERARLRLLPLSIQADSRSSLQNPNPNANPSFTSSLSSSTSLSSKPVPRHCVPHSLVNSPSDLASTDHKDKKKLIVFEFNQITVGLGSTQGRDKYTTTNYDNNARVGVEDESDVKGFSLKHDDHSFKALKTENNIIRLDLEMGLLKGPKAQDVDLELRLGYF